MKWLPPLQGRVAGEPSRVASCAESLNVEYVRPTAGAPTRARSGNRNGLSLSRALAHCQPSSAPVLPEGDDPDGQVHEPVTKEHRRRPHGGRHRLPPDHEIVE